MVDDIAAQRDRLLLELPVLGYRAFDSQANFVLFDGVDRPARDLPRRCSSATS